MSKTRQKDDSKTKEPVPDNYTMTQYELTEAIRIRTAKIGVLNAEISQLKLDIVTATKKELGHLTAKQDLIIPKGQLKVNDPTYKDYNAKQEAAHNLAAKLDRKIIDKKIQIQNLQGEIKEWSVVKPQANKELLESARLLLQESKKTRTNKFEATSADEQDTKKVFTNKR